jgi:hypothetical protein
VNPVSTTAVNSPFKPRYYSFNCNFRCRHCLSSG